MGKGEKHKIGMHEFKMSMQIPELLCDIYAYVLGEKIAWEAVQKAKLFSSDEALAVGLVNESVEVEEVMERAEKYMKRQVAVYGKVYSTSKRFFRKGLLDIVDRDFEPMLAEVDAVLGDKNLSDFTSKWPANYSGVNYSFTANKDGRLSRNAFWRPHGLCRSVVSMAINSKVNHNTVPSIRECKKLNVQI